MAGEVSVQVWATLTNMAAAEYEGLAVHLTAPDDTDNDKMQARLELNAVLRDAQMHNSFCLRNLFRSRPPRRT